MEYPLTYFYKYDIASVERLNPCSNGIPSDFCLLVPKLLLLCLNPCSNGIPSD